MPTLTYNVKVGARAGVSPEHKNPSLRMSEIDPDRSRLLDTYTVPGSVSKFGWESELISLDAFGILTTGSMSFLKDDSAVSAISGYGFIPSSQKIKLNSYVPVSAFVYKRDENSDSIYIKYGDSKDDKYHILITRVGEMDRIEEEDSHNHGIDLDEAGELAIEISHISIPEEKTKVSSDRIIKLDYYPVTNVRVEGEAEYDINAYSGIITNRSGNSITVKYNLAPLVVIQRGPIKYVEAIDPSVTLNLLEVKNHIADGVIPDGNVINAKMNFFIESTGPIDIDNVTYSADRRYTLPPGQYTLNRASSEWQTEANSKIAALDVSVIGDIKAKLLSRYKSDGANPISYDSIANGDIYKAKGGGSADYYLEVVVDNKDRRVILPHLAIPSSIYVQKVGYRNSRTAVSDYNKDAAGTLKFDSKGRYIIRYTPIKENEWEASNSSILSSIVAALGTSQTQVEVYYGTEENGSVEYLNIDNPIIIGSNNG